VSATALLCCTVRQCARPLTRGARAWTCAGGHSFDIARHGYVNLLQPQDRRSLAAGDSKDVVQARARLIAAGVGNTLVDTVLAMLASRALGGVTVAELGSGCGDALAAIAAARSIDGIGIDISTAAAEHAARRFPHLTWVVANADRRLPLADCSVDVALSLHARRNPGECARVLRPGGLLVVAVPASDDLIELRAAVQGKAIDQPRFESLVEAHAPHFALLEHRTARERRALDPTALRALLDTTYRGGRKRVSQRLESVAGLEVTLASEVALLASRGAGAEPVTPLPPPATGASAVRTPPPDAGAPAVHP
jgi:23S rRNA (guanine745-N1)-methyltransferase